jgi:hypothetical protein
MGVKKLASELRAVQILIMYVCCSFRAYFTDAAGVWLFTLCTSQ